jgi:RNA recognition motif-containing protein
MSKRIYVGNLPWSVTKERLGELFAPFGEIEEGLVIANKYTGRSRGFGFVTYKKDADADKAMKAMDGKDIEGRKLVVKLARPSREEEREEVQAEEEQKPKETGKKPKKEKPTEEEKEETEEF